MLIEFFSLEICHLNGLLEEWEPSKDMDCTGYTNCLSSYCNPPKSGNLGDFDSEREEICYG